jgi:L-threonylcarbamoyladenylate synthase
MTAQVIKKDSPDSAAAAAGALRAGEVVIIPTDTVYGFSAAAPVYAQGREDADMETFKQIADIKGRAEGEKPMIRLIARPEDIFLYAASDARQQAVLAPLLKHWPGALTIIVRLKDGLAARENDARAFRCPGDAWLREVIALAGFPVFSTSANMTGSPPLSHIAGIVAQFSRSARLIVDAGDIDPSRAVPSTIVDAAGSAVKIVRRGSCVVRIED